MAPLTTMVGMIPLAIGIGTSAEIMRPLAIAVIGGLVGAMLLTLVVIPCLHLVSGRGAEWLKGKLMG